MAQYHYVIYFDTATETWNVDYETTSARFPEGEVYDYAGYPVWEPVREEDFVEYSDHVVHVLERANDLS